MRSVPETRRQRHGSIGAVGRVVGQIEKSVRPINIFPPSLYKCCSGSVFSSQTRFLSDTYKGMAGVIGSSEHIIAPCLSTHKKSNSRRIEVHLNETLGANTMRVCHVVYYDLRQAPQTFEPCRWGTFLCATGFRYYLGETASPTYKIEQLFCLVEGFGFIVSRSMRCGIHCQCLGEVTKLHGNQYTSVTHHSENPCLSMLLVSISTH